MGHHTRSRGNTGGFSTGNNKSMGNRSFVTKAPVGGSSFAGRRSAGQGWTTSFAPPPPAEPPSAPRQSERVVPRLLCHRLSVRDLFRKGRETLDEWERDGIPTTILNQIDFRAGHFGRVHGLSQTDIDDITGDLLLTVCQAVLRFEEGTVQVTTYARGALDLEYKSLKRRFFADKRHGLRGPQLDEPDLVAAPGEDGGPHQRTEIRELVASQIASLPEDLRDLAERLKSQTPQEIADDIGVHRGTVYRRIQRIRELLDDSE